MPLELKRPLDQDFVGLSAVVLSPFARTSADESSSESELKKLKPSQSSTSDLSVCSREEGCSGIKADSIENELDASISSNSAKDKGKGKATFIVNNAEKTNFVQEHPTIAQDQPPEHSKYHKFIEDVESELWCGICAAILYKPVTIHPCGHAFCSSCLCSYLKSTQPTPYSCPSCRTAASSATFSRVLSGLVNVLVTHAPEKARTQNEMDQADQIWKHGDIFGFGCPPSPFSVHRPTEIYRPCRYCMPNNPYGWACPVPISTIDSGGQLYPLDGPCPDGHFTCSSCSRLTATGSPVAAQCSICEDGYCGSSRSCSPSLLSMSSPGSSWGRDNHSFADGIFDPQSDELLNAFRDNTEELRILGEYISDTPSITPARVHSDILAWLRSDQGKDSGGIRGIFRRVDEGIHSNLSEDKSIVRTCQSCVDDLIACGLYEWWARLRPTVFEELEKAVREKPDCKNGRQCFRQGNAGHSKKFNHVCSPLPSDIIDTVVQDDNPILRPLAFPPSSIQRLSSQQSSFSNASSLTNEDESAPGAGLSAPIHKDMLSASSDPRPFVPGRLPLCSSSSEILTNFSKYSSDVDQATSPTRVSSSDERDSNLSISDGLVSTSSTIKSLSPHSVFQPSGTAPEEDKSFHDEADSSMETLLGDDGPTKELDVMM
ncbi:Predicted E3 ubiquitin ligase [Phaffia rhodozyma]|uniref:Predicted E3 ubiquitin ligase n=1 Tax=Phaffia rhodozyma TaxID=264483 RepID=A0A0F7SHY0_PHARH|nr:Predicted E3 ubiquitin ligase [Phaffia rhodozyma]